MRLELKDLEQSSPYEHLKLALRHPSRIGETAGTGIKLSKIETIIQRKEMMPLKISKAQKS